MGVRITESWQRLTVYAAEPHPRGRSYRVTGLLERAAALGLSGGSVFAGLTGYGHDHHVHKAGLLHRADETPLVVVFVDRPERLALLRAELPSLVPGALAVVDDVEVIRYTRPHRHSGHRNSP